MIFGTRNIDSTYVKSKLRRFDIFRAAKIDSTVKSILAVPDPAQGSATCLLQSHLVIRQQRWAIPPSHPCAVTFFWEEPSYNQFGDPILIGGSKWGLRCGSFFMCQWRA